MARNICIVSAKGGVGKTVVTINLAAAMMLDRRPVVALDADLKMSGLGLQLGMFHFPVSLNDILNGRAGLLEAMYIHASGLRIIPASLGVREASAARLRKVLAHPALHDSTVLVDAPPGLEKNALAVLGACDEAIVLATPEIPAVADAMKTIMAAEKAGTKVLGLVLNRYRKGQLLPKEIESACGVPLLGVVREDREIAKSIFRRMPVVVLKPKARSSRDFRRIGAALSVPAGGAI
ncbi:MAG: P-loop NTPase [Candidatus Aenigmarchaeota archaeon]|nr:P-loop NTPase [Candidatus Aenigmarchaeota archaeon]